MLTFGLVLACNFRHCLYIQTKLHSVTTMTIITIHISCVCILSTSFCYTGFKLYHTSSVCKGDCMCIICTSCSRSSWKLLNRLCIQEYITTNNHEIKRTVMYTMLMFHSYQFLYHIGTNTGGIRYQDKVHEYVCINYYTLNLT